MTLDILPNLFDFYSTVVHELGHAHYLGHINDSLDILYFGEAPGPTPSASRCYLNSSFKSIDGGIYVTIASEAINTSNCDTISTITPIYLDNCGLDLKVPESSLVDNSIHIYPNPFRDKIYLAFDMNNSVNFSYVITDLYGKLISEKTIKNLSSGNHTEEIELGSLSIGIYFVTINIGNETKNAKIIKH